MKKLHTLPLLLNHDHDGGQLGTITVRDDVLDWLKRGIRFEVGYEAVRKNSGGNQPEEWELRGISFNTIPAQRFAPAEPKTVRQALSGLIDAIKNYFTN